MKKINQKGVTFPELIISVAIIAIISALGIGVFSSLSNRESLDADVTKIISSFEKARALAIQGDGASAHGVIVASSTVIVFQGTTISSSNREAVYNLSKGIVSGLSFTNATTSLYFNTLTGKPSATGTITVSFGGQNKTITVFASGLVE